MNNKPKKDNRFDLNDEKFSYVILGTGLTESIIGASLALHGHKCLFLDRADKYGGTICNFNLEQYLRFIKRRIQEKECKPSEAAFHSFEVLIPLDKNKHPEIMKNEMDFKRFSRNFNIDLAPKILFSKSISVDNLIKCGVANYLEFNNVNENYFYMGSQNQTLQDSDLVKIPFSKSEIFMNQVLSFKEKRQLVKVIEICLQGTDQMTKLEKKKQNSTHVYDKEIILTEKELKEIKEKAEQPLTSLFESMNLEKRLSDILLYALGMLNNTDDIKCVDFFSRISKYLRSIGYYGDSPFMMCNYGSSEYAQAFSRIGSLYGNVYIVNEDMEIQDLIQEDSQIKGIEINYNDNPVQFSKGVISGYHYQNHFGIEKTVVSQFLRVTLITKKCLIDNKLSTFTIPPAGDSFIGNTNPIRIYQQNFHIEASPRGTYLILVSLQIDDVEQNKKQMQRFLKVFFGVEQAGGQEEVEIQFQETLEEEAKIEEKKAENPIQKEEEEKKGEENQKEVENPIEQTEEEKQEQVQESQENEPIAQDKKEEAKIEPEEPTPPQHYQDIVFLVQYIQDHHQTSPSSQLSNVHLCPDEAFELDLDDNFNEALTLLLTLEIPSITKKRFLARPKDPMNQDAYDEDNEDTQSEADPDEGEDENDVQDDELDIF